MPLPTVAIESFAPPTVKDGVLTQPVAWSGAAHGFSAPTAAWRAAAWAILAITEPSKPRKPRAPLRKPSGHLL